MFALRKIQEVKSGVLKIDLPSDFSAKRVEIIILPLDEPEAETDQLQKLLLEAPTFSTDEMKEFENVRKWFAQWNVREF